MDWESLNYCFVGVEVVDSMFCLIWVGSFFVFLDFIIIMMFSIMGMFDFIFFDLEVVNYL